MLVMLMDEEYVEAEDKHPSYIPSNAYLEQPESICDRLFFRLIKHLA